MADIVRGYDDLALRLERPDDGYTFEGIYHPIDDAESVANSLSTEDVNEIVASLRRRMHPVIVSTGGGNRDGVRWQDRETSYLTFSTAQIHPPSGSDAWTRIRARLGLDHDAYNNVNINVHQLLWRYSHPLPDGSGYRKVLADVEVSHLAEA